MAWAWSVFDAMHTTLPELTRGLNRRLGTLGAELTRVDNAGVSVGQIPDGAQQPSVAGRPTWLVNNSGATNLSGLREGRAGQCVVLVVLDSNTTLIHSSTFVVRGGANYSVPAGTALTFVSVDGSTWREVGR